MGCCGSVNSRVVFPHESLLSHDAQLEQNLERFGLRKVPVLADGNCLFYALSYGLKNLMLNEVEFEREMWRNFHFDARVHLSVLAAFLRRVCVENWSSNRLHYMKFVDTERFSFDSEVSKFRENQFFDSVLGDIVPLTIANVFHVRLEIITSSRDLSKVLVEPESGISAYNKSRRTIFLAYNKFLDGHYDGVVPRI